MFFFQLITTYGMNTLYNNKLLLFLLKYFCTRKYLTDEVMIHHLVNIMGGYECKLVVLVYARIVMYFRHNATNTI